MIEALIALGSFALVGICLNDIRRERRNPIGHNERRKA